MIIKIVGSLFYTQLTTFQIKISCPAFPALVLTGLLLTIIIIKKKTHSPTKQKQSAKLR